MSASPIVDPIGTMPPKSRPTRRRVTAVIAALILTATFAVPALAKKPADPPGQLVPLQLLAFNDYHGHIESNTPGTIGTTPAGGSEFLATHLAQLRQGHQYSLTVAAGDLIGGTPFISGLFHDEPSVETLNALGLDVSSVGNHEFDEGVTELLRMQNGGCHPVDDCTFPDDPYAGADFQWLAANVVNEETGETPLPPYWIERVQGINVGFIGMTTETTPSLVAQAGIEGWDFLDEAETANALVPVLKARGVEAIIVLLHEGGEPSNTTDINACVGMSGPILQIQALLDPEIDALITGHTHLPYNCMLTDPAGEPRPLTSAFSFGRVISEINLVLDKRTGDVRRDLITATNHAVTQDVARDPAQTAIINKWKPIADEIGLVPVGEVTADIARAVTGGREDRGIESNLGNLIADAQLWATQSAGAQVAFLNPGGIRADLLFNQSGTEGNGTVTYAEAFNVQPFGNVLTTMPMTGAQIISVLEDQCQPIPSSRPFLHLGVSEGLTYTLDVTIVDTPVDPDGGGPLPPSIRRDCTAIAVTDVMLNGEPLDPTATYIVTANNFLADGGDNFFTFDQVPVADKVGGGGDLEQLIAYLEEFSPLSPPGTDRVNELP